MANARSTRRRRLALASALAAAGLALAACGGNATAAGSPGSSTPSNITLNFGYIGTTGTIQGPEGLAYKKGLLLKWLAPAGVTKINPVQFANGPLMTEAIVGGSVNLGDLGDTPALVAYSQGTPDRLVNQDDVGTEAWILAQPNIKTLSQLAGQIVARQQGSYMDRYLQGLLQEKGLYNKVKLVAMLSAQGIPAFESGQVAGIVLQPTQALPLLKKGYNVVAKSTVTPALQGTGLTVISDKLLKQDPKLVPAWNEARDKAIAYANARQPAYYAYSALQAPGVPISAVQEYSPLSAYRTPAFTASGIAQLQGTLNFLVSIGEAKPFSIKKWEAR
jgi:sulfonate transport system substrate-binding protein